MAAAPNRTQADLQERLHKLSGLPETSPRRQALVAASRFKSTWVELGEALIAVRDGGEYKAWGFASFEAYCKNELHLRQDTVLKLTRSFAFLQQHAPDRAVRRDAAVPAPSLDMVHLLSQAAARTQVSQEALDTIGQELLAQNTGASRADALKKLRENDPEAFRSKSRAPAQAAGAINDVDLRKALLLAERLMGLLGEQGDVVSVAAHDKLAKVVQELRQAYGRAHPQQAQTGDANLVQTGQMH